MHLWGLAKPPVLSLELFPVFVCDQSCLSPKSAANTGSLFLIQPLPARYRCCLTQQCRKLQRAKVNVSRLTSPSSTVHIRVKSWPLSLRTGFSASPVPLSHARGRPVSVRSDAFQGQPARFAANYLSLSHSLFALLGNMAKSIPRFSSNTRSTKCRTTPPPCLHTVSPPRFGA